MRKLLSISLVAALTAVTAGCECFNCLAQFEACKNQALFGSPSLCGSTYGAGYQQYGAPCGCAGVADCGGMVVQSPVVSSGCGPSGCGPSGCGPAGCGVAPGMMVGPGQSFIAPGQVVTPSPTVVPGPETYAPVIQ